MSSPGALRRCRRAGDAANNALLLRELDGVTDAGRSARYRCVLVFVRDAADTTPIVREASWEGRIATVPGGRGGFGYDPLFIPAGDTRTVALAGRRREETG